MDFPSWPFPIDKQRPKRNSTRAMATAAAPPREHLEPLRALAMQKQPKRNEFEKRVGAWADGSYCGRAQARTQHPRKRRTFQERPRIGIDCIERAVRLNCSLLLEW